VLVGRLQERIDEEEFGTAEPPANDSPPAESAATEAPAEEAPSSVEPSKEKESSVLVEETKVEEPPKETPKEIESAKPSGKMGGLSFEEQKKKRAERFGIPVYEKPAAKKPKTEGKGKKQQDKKGGKKADNKSKENKNTKKKEPELLSKEEIEKLLARGEKFKTMSKEREDELKTMLRKHRFTE